MLIGDFNINFPPDRRSTLADRLDREFGFVSAFKKFAEHSGGSTFEPPTYYHYRREKRPFHIDYCFIPREWESRIRLVEIPAFHEWSTSDHRPLTVDLNLDEL